MYAQLQEEDANENLLTWGCLASTALRLGLIDAAATTTATAYLLYSNAFVISNNGLGYY